MFEEIGLNEPPHKYGEQYDDAGRHEVDWNYDTVREIAMLLTVDQQRPRRDRAGVRPEAHRPVRLRAAAGRPRAASARTSAPATSTAATAQTAAIPDAWEDAWKWVYDGIWTDHFIMSEQVFNSDAIASGDQAFFSGKVAMSTNFLWITYGLGADYGETGGNWDIAAVPSYNGTITSPLNADTFAILKASKNPDAAFAALAYLMDDRGDELLDAVRRHAGPRVGADAFIETSSPRPRASPPDADWQVASDSLQYADVPNFEGGDAQVQRDQRDPAGVPQPLAHDAAVSTSTQQIDALLAEIQAEWDK